MHNSVLSWFNDIKETLSEYTKYPDQIDTSTELPKATDLVTPVNGESVNRLRSAILAVENELGINLAQHFLPLKLD